MISSYNMVPEQELETLLRNEDRNAERKKHRSHSNVDIFNRWRKRRRIEGYHGLNLDNINLEGADLRGVNFENVRLHDTILYDVNFEGANLRRAVFDYTYADKANFRNADLRDCTYLYKLDADGSNFENADLRGASLNKSYEEEIKELLGNAYFSGTKITPEQRMQLISEFDVPEDYFEGKFSITPRSQYNGPNSWFFKKGLRAHKKAEKEGRIFTEQLNGKTLEYAVIPLKSHEDLHDIYGCAFSMCKPDSFITNLFGSKAGKYAGDWWYFVFDVVPEEFREFAAVHEFGEREGGSHKEARSMEYERVKSQGVLSEYTSWVLQNYPDILIGDVLLVEGGEEALPREVVKAVRKILPNDIEAWKRQEKNEKQGLPVDIWELAWKKGGLTDYQISKELTTKGYEISPRAVRYYRERMEIPNYRAIKKLTFLEPF